MTQGKVIKRPPSSGQHCSTGKSRTLKFSRRMTCLQGASLASDGAGKKPAHFGQHGQHFQLSQQTFRALELEQSLDTSGHIIQAFTSSASFMRRSLPNWFIKTWLPG